MDERKSKLIRVFSSTSATEAHLVRNFLEQRGIQARVSGDTLAHVGLQGVGNIEVYAFEEDAGEAETALSEWRSGSDEEQVD